MRQNEGGRPENARGWASPTKGRARGCEGGRERGSVRGQQKGVGVNGIDELERWVSEASERERRREKKRRRTLCNSVNKRGTETRAPVVVTRVGRME